MSQSYVWYYLDTKQDKRPLGEKVEYLADLCKQRHGFTPNLCLLNSITMGETKNVGKIELRSSKSVQPNNYWFGLTDD